ncbi:homogentisate 1,2-dioxygenase [Alteromonas sp. C1M14]|uniref:homogentisate 1,2-dioxygenase n=1 Tax=Alteromonas sp. C1M14 TaxID=2841567 RepID=UPI001C09FCEE|nr:homogentisate 1,2-dioxygenase [Alteromonas sp. C1M14]MBU2978020.1 homogentisate 1,2-dioxygenase [Alteromonas sp. C1M14]
MANWIRIPQSQGTHSKQAHANLPANACYEREVGRHGFFGPATHLHHKHPPTSWCHWEGDLRPRAFDLNKLPSSATHSPFDAVVLLKNRHCQYRFWTCFKPMAELARNADGDDLIFVHAGSGELFCDFGHMRINAGDYIIIPRSTMWRLVPQQPLSLLMIEATNEAYQLPDRGLLGQHGMFDTAVLTSPQIDHAFLAQQDENRWQVRIKRHDRISTVTYPFNPLDAIGWHGDVCVVKLNWRDIRPVMSHRYHLPPSAHTTFVAPRFVVCTFVPRPAESEPGVLKVPFYHNNDDFDEVLFYHQGNFFSRDNIDAGMVTFHPAGFTHGPHPKAFAAAANNDKTFIDEVAVMLDTRDALQVLPEAFAIEDSAYVDSWQTATLEDEK